MEKIIKKINSKEFYQMRYIDNCDIFYDIELYNNRESNSVWSKKNDIASLFLNLRYDSCSIYENRYDNGEKYYEITFWVPIETFLDDIKNEYETINECIGTIKEELENA